MPKETYTLIRYATAGIEFILTFGLVLLGGLMLDRAAGSTPAFTLLGAAAGFAGGLYRLVRRARQLRQDSCNEGDRHEDD